MNTLLINEEFSLITHKLSDFLSSDNLVKMDFEEYKSVIAAKQLSAEELNVKTFSYIFSRKIEGKSIFELFLLKNKNLSQREIAIINAFNNVISSVFRVEKVFPNRLKLYNLVNEKEYKAFSTGKMTRFKALYPGSYIYCSLCYLDESYFICDVKAMTGADKAGGAKRYAVAKIIENPNNVFLDNPSKLKEIRVLITHSAKKFEEFFGKDEIITTNNAADTVLNMFNDYCETGKSAPDIGKYILTPAVPKYFETSDFSFSTDDFVKKSSAGFSSHSSQYDVGIIFSAKSGLYAVPFYHTFCKIIENDDYKLIENYDLCVRNFLNNDKIPQSVLFHVFKKYPNFVSRINEIIGENLTFKQIIKKFKGELLKTPSVSPAAVLYSSRVFAEVIKAEADSNENLDEEPVFIPSRKTGRNDPCPCGSGKKYKKCCMDKSVV